MPRPTWLSANTHRAFPLIEPADAVLSGPSGPAVLPDAALADFACTVGPGHGTPAIFFRGVARAAGVLTFRFAGDGPLAGAVLAFRRPVGAAEFATDRAAVLGPGDGPGRCPDELVWEGSLTTGPLAEVAALLADGQELVAADGALPVEPICVRYTAGTVVTALNLANVVRAVATAPAGCDPPPPPYFDPGTVVAAATCLRGALAFVAGHNARVDQDAGSATLTLSASPGAGAGPVCGEVPTYPGEPPAPGSSLRTGGPACAEVVSAVNGVSAAVLRLGAGPGVTVSVSPTDPHRLVVAVDGQGLATCT